MLAFKINQIDESKSLKSTMQIEKKVLQETFMANNGFYNFKNIFRCFYKKQRSISLFLVSIFHHITICLTS
jgi:hypothetical protein